MLNEEFINFLNKESKSTVVEVIKSKLKKSGIPYIENVEMLGKYFVDIYIDSGKYDIILKSNYPYNKEEDMKIMKQFYKNIKIIYFNYTGYKDKLGNYHEPLYKNDVVNYKELYRIHYIVYFLYKHGCNFKNIDKYEPFNIKHTGNTIRMFYDGTDSKIFTKEVRKKCNKIVYNYKEYNIL